MRKRFLPLRAAAPTVGVPAATELTTGWGTPDAAAPVAALAG
ncbi:MAG TPA: hypothetical protein VFJ77_04695 [Gaiellaceae bacterium]|nr:hypothetical protein [Gaiellaceae bacterium]